MTRPTVEVLRSLLAASAHEPLWAARIDEQANLGKSTVSQILARLTERQRVALRKERGAHPGRPARALCALTEQGRREAETALAEQAARNQRDPAEPSADAPRARQGWARSGGRGNGLHHSDPLASLRNAAPARGRRTWWG